MSTLREAAIGAMGALETARNGLAWYRDRYPESTDGSDDEAAGDIDAAIDALRAELVKPDAPTVEDEPAPQMPEALRDSLQRRCVEWGVYWRAPDAHGVDLTHEQALELLRDALGVEVEIAAAPRPAPAEPQPEESEFETRADGKTVRKDRWEWTVRRIVALLWGNRREFEVDEVVQAVRELVPAPFNEGDDEGLCRAVLLEHPAPQPAGGEPQPAVQLTEEDVRRIVRDELAKGGA